MEQAPEKDTICWGVPNFGLDWNFGGSVRAIVLLAADVGAGSRQRNEVVV